MRWPSDLCARQDEGRDRPYGGTSASRTSLEPGWRWSECIKPVADTDSRQVQFVGVMVSGTLHVARENGSEQDIGAGQAYVIEPGHGS